MNKFKTIKPEVRGKLISMDIRTRFSISTNEIFQCACFYISALDLNVSMVKGETLFPSYKDLFVLREFVDPELIFLPQKVEYTKEIQSIINAA